MSIEERGARKTKCEPFETMGRFVMRFAPCPSPLAARPSRGVTLVELLITVAIIGILAAAFLGVTRAAMEGARKARTKVTITKLHTLLMDHWSSYTTRRVPISTSGMPGRVAADFRLDAIRLLMKLEMPDRWGDLLGDFDEFGGDVHFALPGTVTSPAPKVWVREFDTVPYTAQMEFPGLALTYLRRYNGLIKPADMDTDEWAEQLEANQSAECLYMIIMYATGDGEARTLFSDQDIGDVDDDGAPEFLDGWGRPIHFIRWPAGFALAGLSELMSADADSDHDPFDYFRRDQKKALPGSDSPSSAIPEFLYDEVPAFRLVPLIYSAGADGDPDLFAAKHAIVGINPFQIFLSDGVEEPLGKPMDESLDSDGDNWIDNIHNHLQEAR